MARRDCFDACPVGLRIARLPSLAAVIALGGVASCSRGPAPVNAPSINPARAGIAAMEQYDTNGDGGVAGDELAKAPGLRAALSRFDKNGDKAVTADEVTARIDEWQASPIGLTSFGFTLTLDGTPVEGATVRFEPEEFLGDDIKAAVATTDMFGTAGPSIPKADRPDPTTPPGVAIGLYQVKISKLVGGKEIVPAAYNEQTTLGQEVAPDVPEIANRRVVYAMKSK